MTDAPTPAAVRLVDANRLQEKLMERSIQRRQDAERYKSSGRDTDTSLIIEREALIYEAVALAVMDSSVQALARLREGKGGKDA